MSNKELERETAENLSPFLIPHFLFFIFSLNKKIVA